jgi:hypothetical protein
MSRTGPVRARRIEVTEEIRAFDTLAEADYSAAWEVMISAGDRRSAEQWARAIFEGAPRALRAFVVTGWIAGLRLRLGPRRSPDYVLGWTVVTTTPDLVILSVQSWMMTAHLMVSVEEKRVVLGSFVRYEKRGASALWSTVQPLHHQILPYLFGRASSRSQLLAT